MERLNFDELIARLEDPGRHYTAHMLTIVGGICSEPTLLDWLRAWGLPREDMPYCLWEEVNCIDFTANTLPTAPQRLERGRVFGEGGDLTLQRDGDVFRWWFIGPPGARVPHNEYPVHAFWDDEQHKPLLLHRHDEAALLWGAREQDTQGQVRWYDGRVARAALHYPVPQGHAERVQVHYWSFTTAGQVMFVWLRKVEAYHG